MFDITVWILIAIIGFIIYVLPAWNVQRSYEGFTEPAGTQPAGTQPAGTQQHIPFNLKDLESLIGTPLAPQDNKLPASSSGLQAQPQEHSTVKSQPGNPTETPKVSDALQQGKAALQTMKKPIPAQQPKVLIKKEYIQVPRTCPPPPACPRVPKCPPQIQCPDMTHYIRKDSIPCWGCKLK